MRDPIGIEDTSERHRSGAGLGALPTWAFLISLAVLSWQWVTHLAISVDWRSVYKGAHFQGETCEVGSGLWLPDSTYDAIRSQPHELRPLAMPYRGAKDPPKIPLDGYILTRCTLDLSKLPRDAAAWVNVGTVIGRSAIYLGGRLKLTLDQTRYLVELPLLPEERAAMTELLIISRNEEGLRFPGLGSLMPVVSGSDRALAERINGLIDFYALELPVARLNYAFGLLLMFGVAWLLGIRYPDVGWMIVVIATLILMNILEKNTASPTLTPFKNAAIAGCKFGLSLSLALFVVAFLRLTPRLRLAGAGFVAATAAWSAAFYLLNARDMMPVNTVIATTGVFNACVLSGAVVMALRLRKQTVGSRRRRIDVFAIVCALGAGAYVAQTIVLDTHAALLGEFLDFGLATAFALFLGVDLVVYHRGFFSERRAKEQEQQENMRLVDQLKIAKIVQELYLPKDRRGSRAGFVFELSYRPKEELAGDWLSYWQSADGDYIFLLGDVTGKGPAAALAVATIAAFINESKAKKEDASRAIQRINSGLHQLLAGHLVSTLTAIVITPEGCCRYLACGQIGVVKLGAQGVSMHASRNQLLGLGPIWEPVWSEIEIMPGEVILTCSDGVVDGQRAMRRLEKTLGRINMATASPENIAVAVEEFAEREGLDDDRTILVLQRERLSVAAKAAI